MKRALLFAGVTSAGVFLLGGTAFAESGPQHFTIFGHDPGHNTVVASGPVRGTGQDTGNETRDRFTFANGSVNVPHKATGGSERFSPTTCIGTFTETGNWQFAGGTGRYAGTTGAGTYKVRGMFLADRTNSGECGRGGTTFFVVNGRGRSNVPR